MDLHLSYLAWGAACAVGVSLAMLVGWLAVVVGAVPPADRRYRDRPPSLLWKMRAPIHILAFYMTPALPTSWEAWLAKRLKMAGLMQAVTPQEMAASCILAGALTALATAVLLCLAGAYSDWLPPCVGALAAMYPISWLRRRVQVRHHRMVRQLPDFLDVVTLCLEAGRNIQGAFSEALAKGPPGPLADEFRRALAELETGSSWSDALSHLAERVNAPQISTVVSAIANAQRAGASLAPTMRAQADQRRVERFARAETLAVQAPVKMLAPLMLCILPCTVLVIGFLIVTKFARTGF